MTLSRPEPEWDWVDVAIMTEWLALTDDTCEHCGRPLAGHEDMDPADFNTGWRTCPAMVALDEAQAMKADEADEKAARDKGRNPDRARSWLTWTDAEGPPQH